MLILLVVMHQSPVVEACGSERGAVDKKLHSRIFIGPESDHWLPTPAQWTKKGG